jgi:membrane protein YdbS with pleckstrin-like domain
MHPATTASTDEAAATRSVPGLPLVGAEPRPHPKLLTYYALSSLVLGPFFWILLIPLYFRYHTMRYRFDEEGVSMRWGILFRREISLTYARIQDIHLSSNFVERWLGLARIQIQTASGNAGAEMTIEGLREYEQIRDFLYARMRGTRGAGVAAPGRAGSEAAAAAAIPAGGAEAVELTSTLRAVADELRALRMELEARRAAEEEARHA